MERKAFLKTLGAGAAFAIAFPCLHGCSSDSGSGEVEEGEGGGLEAPTGIDFTIDLNSSEASNLSTNGGFIIANSIVVARNLEGVFVAGSQVCSHEANKKVTFISDSGGIFSCSEHGARFDQTGQPLNSITTSRLLVYNTEELSNNMLRVFG
ncbi:Rieske 2Fe-2S domain-containing protein [Cellulophaga sp. HaHaR_3_176]|uniref:Rieske 2Fe-2S domain-containing protein n=1 Tax=Cellulophaga sp. HaHaR_3_176 TaxID=1942464 RepID=UPI001C1F6577|nr:Rieske 2Fe-2S domain-containing protein [Cellulophaga sp. HaHaR_3_176]QWX82790.1 Rieske 2Fe-2S domain-containing protein [Cellulophaga sp. HaHaR_3_176]